MGALNLKLHVAVRLQEACTLPVVLPNTRYEHLMERKLMMSGK